MFPLHANGWSLTSPRAVARQLSSRIAYVVALFMPLPIPQMGPEPLCFSDCPSTCVCVHACGGREESSCDRLAIDFCSLQIPASWKFQRLISDRVLIPHAADAACISLPGRNTHASTCLRRGGSAAYRTSAVLVNK